MGKIKIIDLEITFDYAGKRDSIHPTLLQDNKDLFLVDAGYPGQVPLFFESAQKLGVDIEKLSGIIITHHDFDHIGSLAAFKRKFPGIRIISHTLEKPHIEGNKKSLRLTQAEELYANIPESEKPSALAFHRILESVEKTYVDQTVMDNELLPYFGGLRVIHTPGHMPGHIALCHESSKVIIAGDSLVVENNELKIANPQYTLNMAEAKKSVKKLLDYSAERIFCYHGGIFAANIRDALKSLLKN